MEYGGDGYWGRRTDIFRGGHDSEGPLFERLTHRIYSITSFIVLHFLLSLDWLSSQAEPMAEGINRQCVVDPRPMEDTE